MKKFLLAGAVIFGSLTTSSYAGVKKLYSKPVVEEFTSFIMEHQERGNIVVHVVKPGETKKRKKRAGGLRPFRFKIPTAVEMMGHAYEKEFLELLRSYLTDQDITGPRGEPLTLVPEEKEFKRAEQEEEREDARTYYKSSFDDNYNTGVH
jgi:hypothetical protein